MSTLELTFDIKTVSLELGESLSSVEPKLSGLPHETGDRDVELDRRYVTMGDLGVELDFDGDRLFTVRLYIEPRESRYAKFNGRLSLLPDEFFQQPDRDRLVDLLERAGFVVWPKPYPYSVYLVSANLRVGYVDNPRRDSFIFIDDGSMLRRNSS